jgi:hypothetical protein
MTGLRKTLPAVRPSGLLGSRIMLFLAHVLDGCDDLVQEDPLTEGFSQLRRPRGR